MEKSEITLTFDSEKMRAMAIYLKKENATVRGKLDEALRQLYETTVPEPVRDYLDAVAAPPPKPKRPPRPSQPRRKQSKCLQQKDRRRNRMSSQEICIWLDSRWYQALSSQLKDETIEGKLNGYLDELLNQLPAPVYEKISREIWEEDQQRRQELEAARVFTAFHVTEHGQDEYFQFDREVDLPTVAQYLRRYLRQEPGMQGESFSERFQTRESITAEQFEKLVLLRLENTGKVAGVYELDFDRREFSGLAIIDGWKTYTMEDVSAAAYHAFRKESLPAERRLEILLDRLDGKEITWMDRPSEGLPTGPLM